MPGRLFVGVMAGVMCGLVACSSPGPDPDPLTGVVRGSLSYQARLPTVRNGTLNLDRVETLPAAGVLALVVDADGSVMGSGRLGDDGTFAIDVLPAPNGDERVIFTTLWSAAPDGGRVDLAILNGPGGTPGTVRSNPWAWSAAVPGDGDAGGLTIGEEQGSGAMYLFLFVRAAMQVIQADLCGGDESCLRPLAVLWHPGAAWTCGSCFDRNATQQVGQGDSLTLEQSIFVGGQDGGASAWGYAVVLHELGHYAAANWSRDDSPGGPHGYGERLPPPFAWSEGWASFFAVSTFGQWTQDPFPLYWDIQGGTSVWVDYEKANYTGGNLQRPDPMGPMDQDLDESYVACMIWRLWDGGHGGAGLGTAPIFDAFGSRRIRDFDRGATGADFVDFVDALTCAGPGGPVPRTVKEGMGFPYDDRPLCP